MTETATIFPKIRPDMYIETVLNAIGRGQVAVPVPTDVTRSRFQDMLSRVNASNSPPGVLFRTSGSTGTSKMVVRSEESILNEAVGVVEALGLTDESRVIIGTPISHSFGFGMMTACYLSGAEPLVSQGETWFARLVQMTGWMKDQVDVLTGVPFVFRQLLNFYGRRGQPIGPRCSYVGGEIVEPELISRWSSTYGAPLCQEYGLSETGIMTVASPDDPPNTIGRALPGCRVRPVRGELIAYRDGSPTGYLAGESPDTFRKDGGVRTGDIGGTTAEGALFVTGRKSSVIHIGGLNVVPEEVEAVIKRMVFVDDVVVFGRKRPRSRETELVATIAPVLQKREARALRSVLLAELGPLRTPRIEYVPRMPRTESGKVQRHAIS